MVQLTLRDIPPEVLAELKASARERGESVSALVRSLIEQHVARVQRTRDLRKLLQQLRVEPAEMEQRHGVLSDSTEIIRRHRDGGGSGPGEPPDPSWADLDSTEIIRRHRDGG